MEKFIINPRFPLAFIFMLGNASAENNVIYRWVDKNNVVHFTQHQPDHDNYTTIKMANSGNRSSSPAEAVPKLMKTLPLKCQIKLKKNQPSKAPWKNAAKKQKLTFVP